MTPFRPATAIAVLATVAAAMAFSTALVACGSEDTFGLTEVEAGDRAADYTYLIPAGTGEAIDAGEPVEIVPADMAVKVGETLELVNEDDRGHIVGPFYVGANETLRQEFTSPGVFEGVCTVHPSGQVVVTVTE